MKLRTILKRTLCVMMIVLTFVTSVPLAMLVGFDKSNLFVTQVQAAELCSYEEILEKIKKEYPNGSYFSVNGKRCEHASAQSKKKDGKVCSNCNLYSILKSKGIKTSNYSNGYTCYSFVSYCFTQCFGKPMEGNYNVISTSNLKGKSAEVKYDFFKKAKIGDIIRVNGHYMVFIKCDKNGVTLYDSNVGGKWYCSNGHVRCSVKNCPYKGKLDYKKGGYTGKVRYATLKYSAINYSWIQIWHAKNYKEAISVAFNANGGTVSTAKKDFEVGKTYGTLPTPTRSGYKFDGWYTAKTGGKKITSTTEVTKGNKTLYARWSVLDPDKLYTIGYDTTTGFGKMPYQEVLAGEEFTLKKNSFSCEGSVFKGWNVRRTSDGKWYVSGKGWQYENTISKKKYTKKLYKDGESLVLNSSWTKGADKNDYFIFWAVFEKCTSHKWDSGKVTKEATTVKTGVKTFTCSKCKATKTETIARSTTEKYFSKVYSDDVTTNNAKIGGNAKSTANKKGTGFYLGTSKDSMKRYTKNLKGKSDAAGTYTSIYFTLSGWYGKLKPNTTYYYSIFYIDKNGKECASVIKSFKTKGTSSQNNTNAYTFAYNANGGSGSMSSQTVEKNKDLTVKTNSFTRGGYSFQGYTVQRKSDGKWYVSGQGWKSEADITKNKWTKKVYKEGTKLNINSSWQTGSKTGETFTFYAVWKAVACTSHNWDSGKVTKEATTVTTGVKTYTCTLCKKTKTETIARSTTEKYFSKIYANNITSNNAKIGGNAKSTAYKKGTGFYLGTSKDSMKRYTKNLKGKSDAAGTYTSIFFTMSDWHGKLKSNTTYYYSIFYIDKNGKECASVIKSFKTK